MRKRRLALLALAAAALAPGTWVRSDPPPPDYSAPLVIESVPVPRADLGAMVLDGAWQLSSRHPRFGGYSALLRMPDGSFLTASDNGARAQFVLRPGTYDHSAMGGMDLPGEADKRARDLESLTRDPIRGTIWAGFEGSNSIARFTSRLKFAAQASPAAMRKWSINSGPESLVRLGNGRFVVLSEGPDSTGHYPGMVFAGDPVEGAPSTPIRLDTPKGFRPVDMIQDGADHVYILTRKVDWGLPPKFRVKLLRARLADASNDGSWRGEVVAVISGDVFGENYEGMALDDNGALYLISDDNISRLQRTLMLRLVPDRAAD